MHLVPLVALVLLTGCPPTPPNSGTAEAVGQILKEVQASVQQMKDTSKAFYDAIDRQNQASTKSLQFIADRIEAARYYNVHNPQQNDYTLLIVPELAAAAGAGLPPPSGDVQQKAIDKLQLQNSQLEADKARVTAENAQLQLEAANLKGQVVATSQEADKARQTALQATATGTVTVGKLADADAKIRIQAAETERQNKMARDEAAAAARVKVATLFMIIGGVVLVAAVVATVMHVPGVLWPGLAGGGAAFLFGWLITYVEQLMQQSWFQPVAISLIVLCAGALAWTGVHTYRARQKATLAEKGFTAVIGGLQDAKNDDSRLGTAKFAAVKPHIQEWMVDDKGQPDLKLQAEVDKRLVAMNLKNPNGAAPVPVAAPAAKG